jgi:biotin carboxylase
MKTLLIVSGGMEAIPGIRRAKEMGLFVVVSDKNPSAPGFAFADAQIIASTYDVQETVAAARTFSSTKKIDGVICMAADVPRTVAAVAQELGLQGISAEAADLASDKVKMKDKFREQGIPIPWYSQVESFAHLQKIVKEQGYNLVVKPADSRGARGVLHLDEKIDLRWAFNHAKSNSSSQRVIIEEYLDGPQISTESVLLNGKGATPGFIDRNYERIKEFLPYMIENGGHQPTILSDKEKKEISDLSVNAGKALGIVNGTVKGDIVLTRNGAKVIEIAARLSGGWMSTDQIPLATGVDFVGIAIRIALGEPVDLVEAQPKTARGVAIRYVFPAPGKIEEIVVDEDLLKKEWVYKFSMVAKPGDIIESVSNHTMRAGFVITLGVTRESAIERAEKVIRSVQLKMKDL